MLHKFLETPSLDEKATIFFSDSSIDALCNISHVPYSTHIEAVETKLQPQFIESNHVSTLARPQGALIGSLTPIPVTLPETPTSQRTAESAYSLLQQELSHDTDPRYNLATFVSTYMEPEATRLIAESLAKNFVDPRAYPVTAAYEQRCLRVLADMYHLPGDVTAPVAGFSTIGSSEAIMLAVLAMKKRWLQRQTLHNHENTGRLNIIISSVAQVCWQKAARYFDVDLCSVPCSDQRYVLDPLSAVDLVTDQTIGIACILGTTYTGEYEDVKLVNDLLVERGLDVPIHVDAASGGFVAPFTNPNLEWDFRLEKVVSINVSGHKYGLVYPGIGWAIWRSAEFLPADLGFQLSYLGKSQASYTLNFSKSASHIVAQYYLFVRLGNIGYTHTIQSIVDNAMILSDRLCDMGFTVLSKPDGIHGIPVVAFRLKPKQYLQFDEFDLSSSLESRGWLVPAYYMADGAESIKLLRVVCRVDFTKELCKLLVRDIQNILTDMHVLPYRQPNRATCPVVS